MLMKQDKIKIVEKIGEDLKKYNTIALVPISNIPDSLLQSSRNKLRSKAKIIMARKSLLKRALMQNEKTKKLAEMITEPSVLVLANENPMELNNMLKENSIKRWAKPGQTSEIDIKISAGETSIPPGQTVTELKNAGIDVQIQKGKVVIAKDKIVIEKGKQVTKDAAKILRILDIAPFRSAIAPYAVSDGRLVYTKEVLSINKEYVENSIRNIFGRAYLLSLGCEIINKYTIKPLLSKAYMNALSLGVERNIYDTGVIEKILERAAINNSIMNDILNKNLK
ncbi:MAG: 50S ribosomal protein L10 [Candidatus Micrarchaeia archaeon]